MDYIFLGIILGLFLVYTTSLLISVGRKNSTKYKEKGSTVSKLYTSEFSEDLSDNPARDKDDEDNVK